MRIMNAIFVVLLCSMIMGCGSMEYNVSFNENGTISMDMTAIADESLRNINSNIDKDMIDLKNNLSAQGAVVSDIKNGFAGKQKFSDVTDFVSHTSHIFSPNEDVGGVRFRKGYFFDTYSIDTIIMGNERPVDLQTDYNNPYETMAYATLKNNIDSSKVAISMSLPYPADSHNASEASNNDKNLVWDLKPAMLDGRDVPLKVNFRIYHKDNIDFVNNGIILFLCISLLMIVLKFVKKDRSEIQKYSYPVAAILALVAAGCYLYLNNSLNEIPKLTGSDRIIQEGALDKEGRSLSESIRRIENGGINSLDKAKRIMQEKGVSAEAVAVSEYDDEGFLVQVLEEGIPCYVYDAKDDILAAVTGRKLSDNFVEQFRKNYSVNSNGKVNYSPVIFKLYIENEGRVWGDKDMGYWQEKYHILPVYVLFDVNDRDEIETRNIYSGKGTSPSHYQGDVRDEKHIRLAKVVVNHIDSLRLDIKLRNKLSKK